MKKNYAKKYQLKSDHNTYILFFESLDNNEEKKLRISIIHKILSKKLIFYIEKTLEQIHNEYKYLFMYNMTNDFINYLAQLTKKDCIIIDKINQLIYNVTFIDKDKNINILFSLKRKIDKNENLKEIEDEIFNMYKDLESESNNIIESNNKYEQLKNEFNNFKKEMEDKFSKLSNIDKQSSIPEKINSSNIDEINANDLNNLNENDNGNNKKNIFKENNNSILFDSKFVVKFKEKNESEQIIREKKEEECEIFTAFNTKNNIPIVAWTIKDKNNIIYIINLNDNGKNLSEEKHNKKIDNLYYFHNDNDKENNEYIISLSKNDDNHNLIVWLIMINNDLELIPKKIISNKSINKNISICIFCMYSNSNYSKENYIFFYDENSKNYKDKKNQNINYFILNNNFDIFSPCDKDRYFESITNNDNINYLDTYYDFQNKKLYLINCNSNNVNIIQNPFYKDKNKKTYFKADDASDHLNGFIKEINKNLILFESNNKGIHIWDIKNSEKPIYFIELNNIVMDMCFWSSDYLLLSTSKDFEFIKISLKDMKIENDEKYIISQNHYGSKIRKIVSGENYLIIGINKDKNLCKWYASY